MPDLVIMQTKLVKVRNDLSSFACRRSRDDRRARPTILLSKYIIIGKRRLHRRREEGIGNISYMDWYSLHLLLATLAIMLFCVADAFLTLWAISQGGVELNIFMDILIQQGTYHFVIGKYVITAVCLMFLVAHKEIILFSRVRVQSCIYLFLFVYAVLICYELTLFDLITYIPI